MIRFFSYLLIGAAYTLSSLAQAKTLDRLILDINGRSFTQRQIEVYLAVRSIAMGGMTRKALPSSEGWSEALESFRNENLVFWNIENDVQKMAALHADSRNIRRAQERLDALVQKDEKWREFIRSYQVNEQEILSILIRIYQLQAFLWTHEPLAVSGRDSSSTFLLINPAAEWFTVLFQGTALRFYDKAREYKPIQPFGG